MFADMPTASLQEIQVVGPPNDLILNLFFAYQACLTDLITRSVRQSLAS